MIPQPPRVVFDCNIFIQALLNPNGSAAECWKLAVRNEIILFISAEVLAEVSEVLRRPRFKQLLPALTDERIETLIEEIAELAIPLINVPEEFRYERDPDDEPYINLALVCSAQYLVSLDNDLLDLMKPAGDVSAAFQRRFPMIKVVTPAQLLMAMRSTQIH